MADAVTLMKDHFQRKSRAAAPSSGPTQYSWFSAPPQFKSYDNEVINAFLNNAKRHVATTFPVLAPFEATYSTAEEIVLAMAAVGAVFCNVAGSERVAKACYNDARRIAFAKVTFHQQLNLTSEHCARSDQHLKQIPTHAWTALRL